MSSSVIPNPFTNATNIILYSDIAEGAIVKIINNFGEIIWLQKINVFTGDNILDWDGSINLVSGLYTIQYLGENGVFITSKIVKI